MTSRVSTLPAVGGLLVALAICAGLTGGTPVVGGQEKTAPGQGVERVFKSIELDPGKQLKTPLSPDLVPFMTPVGIPGVDPAGRQEQVVEPEVEELKTPKGVVFAKALRYTCDPAKLNKFAVGTQPLVARQFSFSVPEVSWSPGTGHPVIRSYCPYDSYNARNYYPRAKSLQIVPSIAGQNYFVGCSSSAVCQSAAAGQICFAVNDTYYPDNLGYFVVVIYSWSR